jgi:proteic killer suppression protein
MIVSFKCKKTEQLFRRIKVAREWQIFASIALRKLNYLHVAETLDDLKVPPGNMLEKLKGNRKHQYSIRINKQWRICFEFKNYEICNVEIVDYH